MKRSAVNVSSRPSRTLIIHSKSVIFDRFRGRGSVAEVQVEEILKAEETTELAEVRAEPQLSLSPGTSRSKMMFCFSRAVVEVV